MVDPIREMKLSTAFEKRSHKGQASIVKRKQTLSSWNHQFSRWKAQLSWVLLPISGCIRAAS